MEGDLNIPHTLLSLQAKNFKKTFKDEKPCSVGFYDLPGIGVIARQCLPRTVNGNHKTRQAEWFYLSTSCFFAHRIITVTLQPKKYRICLNPDTKNLEDLDLLQSEQRLLLVMP